ncbi:hypothetical protein F2Q70_00034594 [Brassica cretica]|uniref:Uncharacterized protein n=1 Tax=Brassica cretica TaxID=69181 RepID=A0A8S9JW52_BRACR|nr:hypothetical protein F2Q70_00034594 [Brassica cretica]
MASSSMTMLSSESNYRSFTELESQQLYEMSRAQRGAHPRPMLSLESMAWLTDSVGEELCDDLDEGDDGLAITT